MTLDEHEKLAGPGQELIDARQEMIDALAGRLCNFFCNLPRMGKKKKKKPSNKLTLIDPATGPDDSPHRLIIEEDDFASFYLKLTRVFPQGRRKNLEKIRLVVYLELLYPASSSKITACSPKVTEDVNRFLSILDGFLADPAASIAKSGENCVFCGHALTDSASRARGIGPECFGRYGDFIKFLSCDEGVVSLEADEPFVLR